MDTMNMTAARGALLRIDSGVERRLLYLGAGKDVGSSLGLFWHKCESFYLVDPFYDSMIGYGAIIDDLTGGIALYMEGMRLTVISVEEGLWESALPGRRYQVRQEGGGEVKRLCFVCARSDQWLASTTSRYNVAIHKDYAGIDDESDFPLFAVWDRLNEGGIFAQTTASRDATDYAVYRAQGFEPLIKVRSDTNAKVGYADGLHLFRKQNNARKADYETMAARLERVGQALMGKLLEFWQHDPDNDGPLGAEFAGLKTLMARPGMINWSVLQASGDFTSWLLTLLDTGDRMLDHQLILELIEPLKLPTWGTMKFDD